MKPFRDLTLKDTCNVWTEIHPCQTLDDLVGNVRVIESLKAYLKIGNIPNLILMGPHGSGKTTSAKALARSYLGEEFQENCMTVNGAINRGKDVVSEKYDPKKGSEKAFNGHNIISFIRRRTNTPLCKIIMIYDFDHMTKEAQMALRRVMETYADRARFILLVNSIDHVIESIQSRSVILRFNGLTDYEMHELLTRMMELEHLIIPQEILDLLIIHAEGDARVAINNLQTIARAPDQSVETFSAIFNQPSFKTTEEILTCCLNRDAKGAYQIAQNLINDGYQISDIINLMFRVLNYYQIPESVRIELCKSISKCYAQTLQSSTVINFHLLISEFVQIARDFT